MERVAKAWEVAAGGYGRAVAIGRNAGLVAFASGAPVRLYHLRSGEAAGDLPVCPDVIRGGLWFAGGRLVVVCETAVRLYDSRTLARVAGPTVDGAKITAASLAWPRLALGHHDGVVRIYGLDGSPTIEIPVPGPPIDVKSLALSPDTTRVAVAWIQGSIWWWNSRDPATPYRLVRHSNESDTVAFSADGKLFAEEGEPSFTTIWRFVGAPSEKAKLKNGRWVKRILFTRDGKWIVRGGSDGLEIAEIAGPRRVVLDTRGLVEDVAMDEAASAIAAADRDGRLTVWEPR